MRFAYKCAVPLVAALLASTATAPRLSADEGLWLLNRFPKELVKQRYGVEVTDSVLETVRLASVRLGSGGSGSFVSPQGLVFTNHHVISDCIQKLSTPANDYMKDGFLASTREQEKRCVDLEVNVLLSIEDVTSRVNAAIPSGVSGAEANRLRKAGMTRIEKECADASGNRCDVVTLYSGGEYHLYQYKKYSDVRLVFAPETAIAAFGGDPDNFTYPRYCLDFAFVRAYENGKPAATPHYFKWSPKGVQNGELTFVPGHPATTGRLATVAELEFNRDVSYPLVLRRLGSLIQTLQQYSAVDAEHKRVAADNLFSQQNGFKAFTGFLSGLRDNTLMERKVTAEKQLKAVVLADPGRKEQFGAIWDEVGAAYKEYAGFYKPYYLLERITTRGSELMGIARHVLRLSEERAKPNEQRLREYADQALPTLQHGLFAEIPISPSLETAVIADYLRFLRQEMGDSDPTVTALLAGKAPEQAAAEYVSSSRLIDVAERKRLAADAAAVKASQDGMIRLVRLLDGPAREYRKRYEDRVEAILTSSAARIAQARFAVHGAQEYPDATFTLRLSFGKVAGYRNAARQAVPYATKVGGVYTRATGVEPFHLPPSWLAGKKALNAGTPFNFVSTNDTHGGNSGSPTLNGKLEVVGILFDGNLEGLPNRFLFTDEQARSVHVASQVIVESLRKIYKAGHLIQELGLKP